MMMKIEDIAKINVNINVVRTLLDQCEKRLTSMLETSKALEAKATTIFNLYFVCIAAIFSLDAISPQAIVEHLIWSVCTLIIGIVMLTITLIPRLYGNLGAEPKEWLKEDVLTMNDDNLAVYLAYYAHHYQNRINVSAKSNKKKIILLYFGIVSGGFSLLIGLALSYFS